MGKKKRYDPIHDWLDAGIRRAFGDKKAWDKYYSQDGSDSDSPRGGGSSRLQRRYTTGGMPNGRGSYGTLRPLRSGSVFGNNSQQFPQGSGYPAQQFGRAPGRNSLIGNRGALTQPAAYNPTQVARLPPMQPSKNSRRLSSPRQDDPNTQVLPTRPAPYNSMSSPSSTPMQPRSLSRRPGQLGAQTRRVTAPAQLPLQSPSPQASQGSVARANTDMYRLGDMQRTYIEGMVDPRQIQQRQRGR